MKKSPNTPEFRRFTEAVRAVSTISKEEMTRRVEAQKETGERLPKGASLDPAVSSAIRSFVERS